MPKLVLQSVIGAKLQIQAKTVPLFFFTLLCCIKSTATVPVELEPVHTFGQVPKLQLHNLKRTTYIWTCGVQELGERR
jgi:hypothetical protein